MGRGQERRRSRGKVVGGEKGKEGGRGRREVMEGMAEGGGWEGEAWGVEQELGQERGDRGDEVKGCLAGVRPWQGLEGKKRKRV